MYDWAKVQALAIRSCARDGGALFRKHYAANTPFRFALEPMEIDHLDQDYNATSGGVLVKLGVEYSANGAVAAYHILRTHPGDNYQYVSAGRYRERVPAKDIIHLFMPERYGQSCGAPWVHSAIMPLRHLAKYSEAEVVAARTSAAKMGFLVPKDTATPPGYVGPDDGNGNKYMDVEPGSIEQLPFGYDFQQFDPTHPNSAFRDFVKSQLREISAGLGVSYVSLANDLEAVNYSSIRAGLIEEREEWKSIQRWFIEAFVRPVFEDWLLYSLMSGAITDNGLAPLPAAKFDKFNQPEFKARRWAWVDPLKDMQAEVLAVEKGWKSKRSSISESGGDIEDVYSEQAADDALADEYGLDFSSESESANDASDMPKGSNDTEEKNKSRYNENHDPTNGQFSSEGGGGGGGGGSGSGSGGGDSAASGSKPRKERLRDRIEGTQAEADAQVKKADAKVNSIKSKIEAVKQKAESSEAVAKVKAVEAQLSATQAHISDLKAQKAATDARIAALKAKLKMVKGRSDESDMDEIEDEIKELKRLAKEIAKAAEKIEEIESALTEEQE
jgi:lambda family phage portal protein